MDEKPKLKLALLAQLDEKQKQAVVKLWDLLTQGINIKKSDLHDMHDLTRMSNSEITDVSKLARKQLAEICAKDPTVKNSDGSYSLVNLIGYLRGRGPVSHTKGSIEEKRNIETQILETKLLDLQRQTTLNSEVEKMFFDHTQRLLQCLSNEYKVNYWMYENKTAAEAKELLEAFVRRAMVEYQATLKAGPENVS